METISFEITGTLPLLMHNSRLASPLDKYAKELKSVTSKRKKTESDHEAMALIEARGGLYYNDSDGIYIPGENIEAALLAASKLQKLGTTFKRGARVVDINCPMKHDGDPDPDKLIRDPDFIFAKLVKVGTNRVLRTRPIFNRWAATFTVAYASDQINRASLTSIVKDAGELIGLGDWRPRFGLFQAKEV
jgi:hypothetical protein